MPGRLALVLLLVVIGVCLGMSMFQVWRAGVKTTRYDAIVKGHSQLPGSLNDALTNGVDPASLVFRSMTAQGTWLTDKTILLDNKIRNRWVGYHVLTPLRLSNSQDVVLVNRGWVKAPRLRSEQPALPTAEGLVQLSGQAREFERHIFELAPEVNPGRVWQHATLERYRAQANLPPGLKIVPLMLLQTGDSPDALVREWEEPTHPAMHHWGYALMWFAFALMAMAYAWLAWRRP
jgi:surfeit locus 1 family protein